MGQKVKGKPGRAKDRRQAGQRHEVDARWPLPDLVLGRREVAGVAPKPGDLEYRVAYGVRGDPIAHLDHFAGTSIGRDGPAHVLLRRAVQPHAHHHIRVVHAGRPNLFAGGRVVPGRG